MGAAISFLVGCFFAIMVAFVYLFVCMVVDDTRGRNHSPSIPNVQTSTQTHPNANTREIRLKSLTNSSEGDYTQKLQLILHLVKPEIVARCIMA